MANNIKRFCEQKGLTVKDLADAIDVPVTTAYNWTQAAVYPRIDKIELMAKFFGVTKTDLVEDPEAVRADAIERAFRDRPDMKILFNVAKDAKPEEIEQAVKIIQALKEG
jgi:transcriptional regulator with XRE-family HTH domain